MTRGGGVEVAELTLINEGTRLRSGGEFCVTMSVHVAERPEDVFSCFTDRPGSSIRTWLYRIATIRCLNARRSSRRQPAVALRGTRLPPPTRLGEVTWLEPCPDALLDGLPAADPGPEARHEAREAISLAFITAIQRVPPQRPRRADPA